MNIGIAEENYLINDFDGNFFKIKSAIDKVVKNNGELLIFPEMAICGYFPEDLLYYSDFLEKINISFDKIMELTDNITILINKPTVEAGKLINTVYLIRNKEVINTATQNHFHISDLYDQQKYFFNGTNSNIISIDDKRFLICLGNEDLLETTNVQSFDIAILLKSEDFNYSDPFRILRMAKSFVQNSNKSFIYINSIGVQTDKVFCGGSFILDSSGDLMNEVNLFQGGLKVIKFTENETSSNSGSFGNLDLEQKDIYDPNLNIQFIYRALVLGIKDYFQKNNFKNAIIASSGGMDSALVLALASVALGGEHVFALLLPSKFSTEHSIADAVQLSVNLGNPYEILPIHDIYNQFENSLKPIFKELPFDVTEENIQSRIRAVLTMALSNKKNYIVLNTSNKSEIAAGYGTLYGDTIGGLSVIGDLYKTQVYALANYINREKEIIPYNIIHKAPSAELREGQIDAESLPEYDILDPVLFEYIDQRKSKSDLLNLGFNELLVESIIKMIHRNEYKRVQFCPILKVSPVSFGKERSFPIVAKY